MKPTRLLSKNWLEWFERSEEKVQKVNSLEELGKVFTKIHRVTSGQICRKPPLQNIKAKRRPWGIQYDAMMGER